MLKKKKALLSVGSIALSSMIAVSGCGSATSANNSSDATAANSKGPIQLSLWQVNGSPDENKVIKDEIAAFNKANSGKIQVNLQFLPRGGNDTFFEDKVTAALNSGTLPDLVSMDGPMVAPYAANKIIRPIDQYVTPQLKSEFLPSIINQGTYQGHLYTLGQTESDVLVYYNKKMFDEVGLKAPQAVSQAWTWQQFEDAGKKLKKVSQWPIDFFVTTNGGVNEWLTYMGTVFTWSNGGDIISPDGKTVQGYLNGSKTIQSLQYIQNLFNEKLATVADSPDDFAKGRSAIAVDGDWFAETLKQYPNLQWGMMPLPYSKTHVSPSGNWCWGITTQSKHPQATFKLLEWLTNDTNVLSMVKADNQPPAKKAVYKDLPMYKTYPYKVIYDQLFQDAHPRPITPAYIALSHAYAEAFDAAASGKDFKTVLNQGVQTVDHELQRFQH
ncbi:sugar ABC transporter substrate-binding protein [Fodinisporobacter ferrooxydans]|uniref:Sugar ABC transporter substrate-binding protein n=1 Tax=Fodinisporobacter ferrooxydans TaxID=2901836 RepID=A0ABY4CH25_9BACL|nr:sugar ABC transporter substrate-binding protein [Alicyclobacillaceae bacterium MYW30-H2]